MEELLNLKKRIKIIVLTLIGLIISSGIIISNYINSDIMFLDIMGTVMLTVIGLMFLGVKISNLNVKLEYIRINEERKKYHIDPDNEIDFDETEFERLQSILNSIYDSDVLSKDFYPVIYERFPFKVEELIELHEDWNNSSYYLTDSGIKYLRILKAETYYNNPNKYTKQ